MSALCPKRCFWLDSCSAIALSLTAKAYGSRILRGGGDLPVTQRDTVVSEGLPPAVARDRMMVFVRRFVQATASGESSRRLCDPVDYWGSRAESGRFETGVATRRRENH